MDWVPLADASGSTIALVNPASPGSQPPAISYDPSGTRSASGLGDSYPFLYQGMESEVTEPYPFYYGGGGGFYNPQIQRGLSITGAQGTSGPGGGPGPGQASLPAVGSSSPNPFNPVSSLQLYEQSQSLGDIAGNGASDLVSALGLDIGTGPVGPIVQYAYFLAMWFDELFGGGSPDYPPNYFTFQFRLNRKHGGRHPLYTVYIGIGPGIVVGMGGVRLVSAGGAPSPNPPLVKDPPDQFGGLRRGMRAFALAAKALHPLEVLGLNELIFVGAAAHVYAGATLKAAGCASPIAPVACVGASVLGGELIGIGFAGTVGGYYLFKDVTLPAFEEDWGL
jgi:hypothetical protein